jgi:hypothetical protein
MVRLVQPWRVSIGFWFPDTEGTEDRMCSIMTGWEFEKIERGLNGGPVGVDTGVRGCRTKSMP